MSRMVTEPPSHGTDRLWLLDEESELENAISIQSMQAGKNVFDVPRTVDGC